MHFLNPNSGLIRVGFASPAKGIGRSAIGLGVFLFLYLFSAQAQISGANWGKITAPVYGTSETVAGGAYSNAELFAGPNKFGNYFSGVLPNGRKVTPTGTTIQIGMNPLGIALTPDGKYLITSNDDELEGGFARFHAMAMTISLQLQ